jgi:Carboxypeptidase regulatory-like domain
MPTTRTWVVLLLLLQGLVGCGRSDWQPTPSAPSSVQQPPPAVQQPANPNQLIVFKDPLTGLSTSDVRDAQEHIVQFTMASELVWTADGRHLPGHSVQGPGYQSLSNVAAEPSCQCWLVVRFGASSGERRAYLTADYIHFNPRTVVALEIASGALIVSRTDVFPPGTYTLSGVVTEATEALTPIENVVVSRLDEEGSGWDEAKTDRNGFYEIRGLTDESRLTAFSKDGYQKVERADFPIHGDMRFDVQLIRR